MGQVGRGTGMWRDARREERRRAAGSSLPAPSTGHNMVLWLKLSTCHSVMTSQRLQEEIYDPRRLTGSSSQVCGGTQQAEAAWGRMEEDQGSEQEAGRLTLVRSVLRRQKLQCLPYRATATTSHLRVQVRGGVALRVC